MAVSKFFGIMDNNLLTATNLTPSKEDSSYPIENLLDATSRSKVFKPTSNDFNFTIDLGWNAEIKFIGMVGPSDEIFGISPSASITIQANNINDFAAPPYELTTSPTYRGLYVFLHESYRYWKITIDDSQPTVNSIGYFYMGDMTQLATRTINRGFSSEIVDQTRAIQALDGTLYFDEKPKFHTFSGLSLGYLSASDRATLEKVYFDNGRSTPMFFTLDPTGMLSSDLAEFTKLMYFQDPPKVGHEFNDLFSMSFQLREVI